jgi:hypothetical protein
LSTVEEAPQLPATLVNPVLASFLDLEDQAGGDALRDAIKSRRYGKRELNFNCFDVVIDVDAGTVEFVGAIDLDGLRAVLCADEVLDALRPLSDGRPS